MAKSSHYYWSCTSFTEIHFHRRLVSLQMLAVCIPRKLAHLLLVKKALRAISRNVHFSKCAAEWFSVKVNFSEICLRPFLFTIYPVQVGRLKYGLKFCWVFTSSSSWSVFLTLVFKFCLTWGNAKSVFFQIATEKWEKAFC